VSHRHPSSSSWNEESGMNLRFLQPTLYRAHAQARMKINHNFLVAPQVSYFFLHVFYFLLLSINSFSNRPCFYWGKYPRNDVFAEKGIDSFGSRHGRLANVEFSPILRVRHVIFSQLDGAKSVFPTKIRPSPCCC
jgi:hypothetical protein